MTLRQIIESFLVLLLFLQTPSPSYAETMIPQPFTPPPPRPNRTTDCELNGCNGRGKCDGLVDPCNCTISFIGKYCESKFFAMPLSHGVVKLKTRNEKVNVTYGCRYPTLNATDFNFELHYTGDLFHNQVDCVKQVDEKVCHSNISVDYHLNGRLVTCFGDWDGIYFHSNATMITVEYPTSGHVSMLEVDEIIQIGTTNTMLCKSQLANPGVNVTWLTRWERDQPRVLERGNGTFLESNTSYRIDETARSDRYGTSTESTLSFKAHLKLMGLTFTCIEMHRSTYGEIDTNRRGQSFNFKGVLPIVIYGRENFYMAGEPLKLECVVTLTPDEVEGAVFRYLWTFKPKGNRDESLPTMITNQRAKEFYKQNVTIDDYGQFSCQVISTKSEGQANVFIKVYGEDVVEGPIAEGLKAETSVASLTSLAGGGMAVMVFVGLIVWQLMRWKKWWDEVEVGPLEFYKDRDAWQDVESEGRQDVDTDELQDVESEGRQDVDTDDWPEVISEGDEGQDTERDAWHDMEKDAWQDIERDAEQDLDSDTWQDADRKVWQDIIVERDEMELDEELGRAKDVWQEVIVKWTEGQDVERDMEGNEGQDVERDEGQDVERDSDQDTESYEEQDMEKNILQDTERDTGQDVPKDEGQNMERDMEEDTVRDEGQNFEINGVQDIVMNAFKEMEKKVFQKVERDTGQDVHYESDPELDMERNMGQDMVRKAFDDMEKKTFQVVERDTVQETERDAVQDMVNQAFQDIERDTGQNTVRDAGQGTSRDTGQDEHVESDENVESDPKQRVKKKT